MNFKSIDNQQAAIECLLASGDLDRLDNHLSRFNLFEAIGMVNQEIKHSAFLAFLLDPHQSHGFGDSFLQRFLQIALLTSLDGEAISNPTNLMDAVVKRELENIDIFILSHTQQIAVIVENKVYAAEQTGQLDRYFQTVQRLYPEYQIVGIFLTLDGRSPIREEDAVRYRPLTYNSLLSLVDEFAATALPDVAMALSHYAQMLRSKLMGDTELEDMCLNVYREHRQAIDTILRYLPNRRTRVTDYLAELVDATPGVVLSSVYKRKRDQKDEHSQYVSFCPASLDSLVPRIPPDQYNTAGRNLGFWLGIRPKYMDFTLQIRRGPLAEHQKLFDIAVNGGAIFNRDTEYVLDEYTTVYRHLVIPSDRFESLPWDVLKEELKEWWDNFCATDLPKIEDIYCTALQADPLVAPPLGEVPENQRV